MDTMSKDAIEAAVSSSFADSTAVEDNGTFGYTEELNKHSEQKLLRKLDLHLVPIVMLLYMLSFLDRVNIGNARLYKMTSDLSLDGNEYQVAVSIFYLTFLVLEVPSNLVLQKFTPSRYIAVLTICWGIICTLTGICQTYAQLLACRLLLGIFDAGLFPGLAIYLTMFYTKKELGLRIGYLFVSAAIAGACGGLLAYGIGHMSGIRGMEGWRWIFILEGIPTVLVGVAVPFLLPSTPDDITFLSDGEKQLLKLRKSLEAGQTASAQRFHWSDVKKAFTTMYCWVFYLAQFGCGTMLYGYSNFLPTIIDGLGGWSVAQAQALTIPCYTVGAISYIVAAYLSDRWQQRGIFVASFGVVSIIGYALLISPVASGVRYFACFVVAVGLYVVVGLPLAWLPANAPRYGMRTAATGMQLTIGTSSGIMSPFIYPTSEGPRYIKGHTITMAMVAYSSVVFIGLSLWFRYANRRRAEGKDNHCTQGLSEDENNELGHESPNFYFTC
ncbi:high-affinity nicotinic acid transporter [Paecilomyces variotii No. 5]|uniref:High-affinity nicotinic acid transporter n=1 Tax=Byssochlamys spectabilis (strain No. 5 / NBRC 109023) TaxID=1356009 RepID=V5G9D1_BYSSN|nr:high-affinity nicotinic acid transporter [Paecilomyces variotii No. 5]